MTVPTSGCASLVPRKVGHALGVHRLQNGFVQRAADILGNQHVSAQSRQEPWLHLGTHPERFRIPLPGTVHTVEAAVVQLVAEVQGELEPGRFVWITEPDYIKMPRHRLRRVMHRSSLLRCW
ncbi:hypothetical protein ACWCP8_40530 [Streptomyces sp. NPDC002206]